MTVFFSSHILGEVRRLCERVGIIRGGELVTVEPIDTLLMQSGKTVRLSSRQPIPDDVLAIDGVSDLETGSAGGGATDGFTECAFTFTGDINELLARLPTEDLLDCSIEEAPLEDVFMQFYGGDSDV